MKLNKAIKEATDKLCIGYYFDDLARLNKLGDNAKLPGLFRNYPEIGYEDNNLRNFYKIKWNALLFFCDKCEFDFDNVKDIQPIVERMIRVWVSFRQEMNKRGFVFSNVVIQQVVNKFDVNVAGISVSCTIEEKTDICMDW